MASYLPGLHVNRAHATGEQCMDKIRTNMPCARNILQTNQLEFVAHDNHQDLRFFFNHATSSEYLIFPSRTPQNAADETPDVRPTKPYGCRF